MMLGSWGTGKWGSPSSLHKQGGVGGLQLHEGGVGQGGLQSFPRTGAPLPVSLGDAAGERTTSRWQWDTGQAGVG